jgi:hypothetical protein
MCWYDINAPLVISISDKTRYVTRFKVRQYESMRRRVMGRIVASVTITNISDPSKSLRCDALVDTGASFMVLPNAWKDRLGDLEVIDNISRETATQETVEGQVCGPVGIQIEGFRPIFNEVLFVEMKPEDGIYEPLIG